MAKQPWREHAIELTGAFVLAFGVVWLLRRRLERPIRSSLFNGTSHPPRIMAMAVGRCI